MTSRFCKTPRASDRYNQWPVFHKGNHTLFVILRIFSRIKFFGPCHFAWLLPETGSRDEYIHTHVTSGCVNWWRRSFRYKYLNETRVQIHAAHTKQIPRTLPFLISFGPHICGYPSPASSSFNRSPRCTWVLCLDDGVRCTRLYLYYQRKIERLHKLSLQVHKMRNLKCVSLFLKLRRKMCNIVKMHSKRDF